MSTLKAIDTAKRLTEARDVVKRLQGDRWKETVAELRPLIEAKMRARKSDNVLEVVLPIAKEMDANGHSPLVLMAVACEMCEPGNRLEGIE